MFQKILAQQRLTSPLVIYIYTIIYTYNIQYSDQSHCSLSSWCSFTTIDNRSVKFVRWMMSMHTCLHRQVASLARAVWAEWKSWACQTAAWQTTYTSYHFLQCSKFELVRKLVQNQQLVRCLLGSASILWISMMCLWFMNSLGPNRARRRLVSRLRHALSSVGTKLHAFGDDELACSNPWDHCQMGTLPEFQGQTTLHMYGDTVDSIVILLEYCNGSR